MERPKFPENRILREGERSCQLCGYGERQHRHLRDEPPPRGHAFPFTRLHRFIANITLWIWPTRKALYITGRITTP